VTTAPGPVVDGLQINDWSREILLECRAGGIDAVNATCAVWEGADETRRQVAALRDVVEANADLALIAADTADVARARAEGRTAILPGFQNASPFERDVDLVDAFHAEGVRIAQLTYNRRNEVGGACYDAVDEGLTSFGAEVIARMNAVGMLVDLSHVSPQTMADAIRISSAPVIFSHSSARSVADHPRNVPDEILRKMPANGGVVMVNFFSGFVVPSSATRLAKMFDVQRRLRQEFPDDAAYRQALKRWMTQNPIDPGDLHHVIDHIDHIARTAGIYHVGLGSDFDGVSKLPVQLEDVSTYPLITQALLDRGYTAAEINQICSGNILRVMRAVERIAADAANPSTPRPCATTD